jgi:hypothetical protein
MPCFDAIILRGNGDLQTNQVTLQRSYGGLELGQYVPHDIEPAGSIGRWTPNGPNPQKLLEQPGPGFSGFGVDDHGNAYYDSEQVDPGDERVLWGDPYTMTVWLGGQADG